MNLVGYYITMEYLLSIIKYDATLRQYDGALVATMTLIEGIMLCDAKV